MLVTLAGCNPEWSVATEGLARFLLVNPSYIQSFGFLLESSSKEPASRDFDKFIVTVNIRRPFAFGGFDSEFFQLVNNWCHLDLPRERDDPNLNVAVGKLLECITFLAVRPRYDSRLCQCASDSIISVDVDGNHMDSGGKKIDVTAWNPFDENGEFYECKAGRSAVAGGTAQFSVLQKAKDILGSKLKTAVIAFIVQRHLTDLLNKECPDLLKAGVMAVGHDTLAAGFF